MIINNQIKVNEYDPYIKTEETIFELLERDRDLISDEFELMPYPLAHWINTFGIQTTNKLISDLQSDNIRVFVCQHIYVDRLTFKDSDMIFTPHSSTGDRFNSIPHYAVHIDESLMSEDRTFNFSFLGSVTTHKTRKNLVSKYPNNCFNTKVHWGLDKGMPKDFNTQYTKLLGDSIFSVCPRGTGISSVRLFESMAMGSLPIIVADNYDAPLSSIVQWSMMSFNIPEKQALDHYPYLNQAVNLYLGKEGNIEEMRKYMKETYNEYFSNENLHKSVLLKLTQLRGKN